jgi:3-oxoisoapionate decarboxylase
MVTLTAGLSSYAFAWACRADQPIGWRDLLNRAQALGGQVVQIANNLTVADSELDALHEMSNRLGLTLELGTRGIDPAHLRLQIARAVTLGARMLRCVIDTPDHKPAAQEIVDTIRETLPLLEKHDITLALENHDRLPAEQLALVVRLFTGTPVGVCLDTANSLGCEEPLRQVVETLAPFAVNLHVKDYVIERIPGSQGFFIHGAPLGEGRLDLAWLLPYVRQHAPRDLSAVLEQWVPDQGSLSRSITVEADWAARSMRRLNAALERVSA